MAHQKPRARRTAARSTTAASITTAAKAKTAMLAKIKMSSLDSKDATALKFAPHTATTCGKLKLPAIAAGFLIPYFDLSGKVTKFWRYRYLENTKQKGFDALTEKKPLRYAQLRNTVNELYLPPIAGTNWSSIAKNPDIPVCITEGELKAACATKLGFPTIGLGGVWCFKSNGAALPLLPMFNEFNWRERTVYIVYDSDAVTNPQVMAAENALAKALVGLGAAPCIARIPFEKKVDKKIGLDDFLVAEGTQAFQDLLDNAAEWRAAQELFALNQEVAYVRDPGLILRMDTLQRISPRAFMEHAYSTRIYYEEQVTEKGTKLVERSAAKEWIKWPHRVEVAKVVYEPGKDRINQRNELNIWPGWAVQPAPGDVSLWNQLLDHIFKGDMEARTWFERWCAHPLQNPGDKMYSSAVVWGLYTGTGKSLIGYSLGKIYGKNFTEIEDREIFASHNEWAENKQFVMGDEITGGDKRGVADKMKGMITRHELRLNPKYVPSYTVLDCINYYFTSNHPDSFFLEDKDRRYFIWEVIGGALPLEFYKRYEAWIGAKGVVGPGASALFHHLLTLPMGDFDAQAPAPYTAAKREMIEGGRSDLASWVAYLRESPDTVLRVDGHVLKFDLWRAEDLLALYDPEGRGRVTTNGMSRELKRAGLFRAAQGMGVRTSLGQIRVWAVRNYEKYMGLAPVKIGELYEAERGMSAKAKQKTKKRKF